MLEAVTCRVRTHQLHLACGRGHLDPLHTIRLGQPWPLGSIATAQGVNFALAAPMASRVELLLFASGNAPEPHQVVELDHRHRSGDIWHVEV